MPQHPQLTITHQPPGRQPAPGDPASHGPRIPWPGRRRKRRRRPPLDPLATLRITDLAAGDTETVAEVFTGLSDDSRYLRFRTGYHHLPNGTLRLLADVHPGHHVVHVARVGDRPVGLIRWVRLADRPQAAELAVEVIDVLQGRGIGTALFEAAVRSADAAGIDELVFFVASDNTAMTGWLRLLGATHAPDDPDERRLPMRHALTRVA